MNDNLMEAHSKKGVKLVYNNEIRKVFSIDSYAKLMSTIGTSYSMSPDSYTINYYDEDNDFITISSEDDLIDAAELFNGQTMKLYITPVNQNNKSILKASVIDRKDLAQSVSGWDEMSELVSSIGKDKLKKEDSKVEIINNHQKQPNLSHKPSEPVDHRDEKSYEHDPNLDKSESIGLKKVESTNSANVSDATSVFNIDEYEKDLEEGKEMINEMSTIVQDMLKSDKPRHKYNKEEQKVYDEMLQVIKEVKNREQSDMKSSKTSKKEDSKIEKEEPKPIVEPPKEKVEVDIQAEIQPFKEPEPQPIAEPVIPQIDPEEVKAMGIKQAREYELNYLKKHLERVYKDTIHKNIECSLCNADHVKGVRYLCIYCEDYNLCMKCEKLVDHDHPMLKFKTSDHFEQYKKDLLNKYPEILDINEVEHQDNPKNEEVKKVQVEEDKMNPNDRVQPKIINNINFEDIDKYNIYSDELLDTCKVECVNVSPADGHVISVISSDICLTVSLKNTGDVSWPKGFKVKSLLSTEDAISAQLNEVEIKPEEQILIDVFIKNPKQVGKYYFMFALIDINGRRFGEDFSFAFEVKNNSCLFGGLGGFGGNNNVYNPPYFPVKYNDNYGHQNQAHYNYNGNLRTQPQRRGQSQRWSNMYADEDDFDFANEE